MDLRRVTASELIASAGGLLLLIALPLHWYGLSPTFVVNGVEIRRQSSAAVSGWSAVSNGHWVFLITALLAIALALVTASGQALNVPFRPSFVLAVLGSVSALWILWRIVIRPGEQQSVRSGILIALIGAGLLTFGAYHSMQDAAADLGDFRQRSGSFIEPDA